MCGFLKPFLQKTVDFFSKTCAFSTKTLCIGFQSLCQGLNFALRLFTYFENHRLILHERCRWWRQYETLPSSLLHPHMIPVRIIEKVSYREKGLCVVTSSRSTVVCFFLFFKKGIFRYPVWILSVTASCQYVYAVWSFFCDGYLWLRPFLLGPSCCI